MAITSVSTSARAQLSHCQARLDADLSARNSAARAVAQDEDAMSRAQQAARRELQSRSNKGRIIDVTA
ncbi:hypothetical protein [Actinoplanes subtropicus]|jgi:hypothetical protein|uniref:hypothetical protein n=1 Tax=Actinoplanes subtropicus TaxID=543632 RepID=UPI0004C34D55|nr:hypothetical protein [Actinoplanes subtropicus]